jgi:hypothetical protein
VSRDAGNAGIELYLLDKDVTSSDGYAEYLAGEMFHGKVQLRVTIGKRKYIVEGDWKDLQTQKSITGGINEDWNYIASHMRSCT